jgi:acyl-CoA synthetase (AMP-forming)/AMP-acid ligase II
MAPVGLLDWLQEARGDTGIHVLGDASWELHPYERLADLVCGVSGQLREAGVETDDLVAITCAGGVDFAAGLFGALHAGATPVPMAARPDLGDHYLAALLADTAPTCLVVDDATAALVAGALTRAGLNIPALRAGRDPAADLAPAPAAELALLQLTSGSSGRPRGVQVSWHNLESQVALIRRWLQWSANDSAASWLPLHHDMGLIGLLITSVTAQTTLWQMRPDQFLASPLDWIACFGAHEATITAAPTFGYSYAARRVQPDDLGGLGFSGWRSAVVGAERVSFEALAAFQSLLSSRGFRETTLRPAYGLAEGTLAVTGTPIDRAPRTIGVDWARLRPGEPVEVVETDFGLVSCGPALDGVKVSILDEDGAELTEPRLGEIVVEGASVAMGYRRPSEETVTRFERGKLFTGDAGFLLDGELFVVGRIADSFKVRGVHIFAEGIESDLARAIGIPAGKCVVVPAPKATRDGVAVVVEGSFEDAVADETLRLVRASVGPSVDISLYLGERGTIPRTTSGKPRRREMWRQILTGETAAETYSAGRAPLYSR